MSTRDRILSSDDIESEVIEVPQWGVKVEVRGLSGRERAKYLKQFMDEEELDYERLYPALIVGTVYDVDTAEKVFQESDLDALSEKSGAALELVAGVASRLSGLDREAVNRAGKDSGSTPTATSPSS